MNEHKTEQTLRLVGGFVLLFMLSMVGLSFNKPVFYSFMKKYPPFFYLFKYSYLMLKPLYLKWYLGVFSYVIFCWINAGVSYSSVKPLHPEKGYMIAGYSVIPNNQNLILGYNGISIALNFLLFYALQYAGTFFWPLFLLFFLSLLSSYILAVVLVKSFVFDNLSHESELAKRLKQNKEKVFKEFTIWWKTAAGYCLVHNPFQGILIVGGPGAGKSYTLVENIIEQTIGKGWTALIYDFKFPTLGTYTWNVYKKFSESNKPKLYTIYFKDVRYSHRCNPLDPSILTEMTMANEASKTILYNINLTWAQKSGDFWSDSAVNTLTGMIWWLRSKSVERNLNVCTLPHAIALSCYEDQGKVIEVLMAHPEVAVTISALRSAHRGGAAEQLAGQMSTLQNSMSKISDRKMAWVMSGNDFTLDLNSKDDPKILILGNDDMQKKAFAPALSLYASTVAGLINQKNRLPCAFIIDEVPTLIIQNLENLPNTGRSNKIATVLGMQDKAQMNLNYGDKAAEVLQAGLGNVFIGQTSDQKTSRYASELIGKEKTNRKNLSTGANDVNISFNENLEYVIHQHEMATLKTGEFVGKVSVPMAGNKSEQRFLSKFFVNKPSWYNNPEEMPKVFGFPDLSPEEEEKRINEILESNLEVIKKEIEDLVNTEYWRIKIKQYVQHGDALARKFYLDYTKKGTLDKELDHYIEQAQELYNAMQYDPTVSGDLNKKVLEAIVKTLMLDIQNQFSNGETNPESLVDTETGEVRTPGIQDEDPYEF